LRRQTIPTGLRILIIAACVCGGAILFAEAAFAAGGLTGVVEEPPGRPSPLAQLTLVRGQTGEQYKVVADEEGNYAVAGLPAGSYSVFARSRRGGAAVKLHFVVEDGRQIVLPVRLAVSWTPSVSIPLRTFPLSGRYYIDAVARASEITRGQQGGNIEGYGPYSPRGNSAFNSIGQRAQSNNYLLDGADNNEPWLRGELMRPSTEFIESTSLAAIYVLAGVGHAAGGSIEATTRRGGNRFHGNAFDYFQSSALSARNFFDGAEKAGLLGNRFGATIGGPLPGNRWFFFLGADLLRERRGLTVISTVPTAEQKAGDFGATPIFDPTTIRPVWGSYFERQPYPGSSIPTSEMSPAGRKLVALYPDPNLPGLANNYRFQPNRIDNCDSVTLRIDRSLKRNGTLFSRFSYERYHLDSPSAFPDVAASDYSQHANAGVTSLKAWNGVVSHTAALTPSFIGEFRASVGRFDIAGHASDAGADVSQAIGVPGLDELGLPVVAPKGYTQLGASMPFPLTVRNTNYQIEQSFRWARGRHSWSFGFQAIRRHADGTASEWSSRGTFLFTPDYTSSPGTDRTGNSIATLLLGYPAETRRDIQLQPYRLRAWEWGAYLQDEFRLLPRLTISAGLRYSLYPPLTEANDRIVNFNFDLEAPALDQFAGQGAVNRFGGIGFRKTTVAPRIGFACDVTGNGRTVLRGGFSMGYDTGAYYSQGRLARNPPFASRLDIINGSYQLGTRLDDGLPPPEATALLDVESLNRARTAIYAIEPDSYTPYADQWGLVLEHALASDLRIELSGAGSMGMHLYGAYDANQPYPAPDPYPYPRYPFEPLTSRVEYLGYAAGSTYYGGQARVEGRILSGLLVNATYRYAHQIDDGTEPSTPQLSRPAVPQYIYHLRGVRSASPYDIKHRLMANAMYELPASIAGLPKPLGAALGGWTTSAFVTLQTGFPFAPEMAVNPLNNGAVQLPNRVGSGVLPAGERSHLRWFNTSLDPSDPDHAFEFPGAFEYGNAGLGILRGPGLAAVDIALHRRFRLMEGTGLELRFEAFNLLNRVNLALPNRVLEVDSAGVISHTATPSRQIRISAMLDW